MCTCPCTPGCFCTAQATSIRCSASCACKPASAHAARCCMHARECVACPSSAPSAACCQVPRLRRAGLPAAGKHRRPGADVAAKQQLHRPVLLLHAAGRGAAGLSACMHTCLYARWPATCSPGVCKQARTHACVPHAPRCRRSRCTCSTRPPRSSATRRSTSRSAARAL